MATEIKASVSYGDTEITPIFARKVDAIFGGHVTILPNVAVLNSARRQSRRGKDVELSVAADRDGIYTVYQVGANTLLIDAYDNSTIDLDDVIMDDEERAGFVATYPELSGLIAAMYVEWSS